MTLLLNFRPNRLHLLAAIFLSFGLLTACQPPAAPTREPIIPTPTRETDEPALDAITPSPIATEAVAVANTPTPLPTATDAPTATPAPTETLAPNLIPSQTIEPQEAAATPEPTAEPEPTVIPTDVPIAEEAPLVAIRDSAEMERFGISGYQGHASLAADSGLDFAIYMDWLTAVEPDMPPGVEYWQMIRIRDNVLSPPLDQINTLVAANPGSVWLISNEPDVIWQDNTTAENYATQYHAAYTAIKAVDPTAIVSAGGISQATPLRLQYLDMFLAAYEAQFGTQMPTDMWNIHVYMLREERNSWGIDIPPGMEDVNEGVLYEIADHNDLGHFASSIEVFRQWMADNGYQETPLAITEFGILLPHDYGFPPEVIGEYMHGAFDLMMTMSNETGYSADNNRLVQHWIWYVVQESEDRFPFSNLVATDNSGLTIVGQAYQTYVETPR